MGSTSAAVPLSASEIAAYHTDGLIVPSYRLPADRVAEMRAALDRLIADNPGVRPEHLVLRWGGGGGALPAHAAFLDFAQDAAVLDVVEQILGPDLILWGSHVFCKPAGDGLEIPWHQDGQYWPIRPLATCTVWIALDHSTPKNGCLRYIPGSHRQKTVFHHRLDERPGLAIDQVIEESQFDEGTARDVVLEPGQMSIHDVYLIHGSRANRSERRRTGVATRYMPSTSLYDRSIKYPGGAKAIRQDMSLRPIYLVRGRDRHGGNDFRVGQDQPFAVGVAD